MSREIHSRKRRKTPSPIQGIEIALKEGGRKHAHNWRESMNARHRTVFRRLFVTS
jgi:hypothetical protein